MLAKCTALWSFVFFAFTFSQNYNHRHCLYSSLEQWPVQSSSNPQTKYISVARISLQRVEAVLPIIRHSESVMLGAACAALKLLSPFPRNSTLSQAPTNPHHFKGSISKKAFELHRPPYSAPQHTSTCVSCIRPNLAHSHPQCYLSIAQLLWDQALDRFPPMSLPHHATPSHRTISKLLLLLAEHQVIHISELL